jgi:hypothetical protein
LIAVEGEAEIFECHAIEHDGAVWLMSVVRDFETGGGLI